MASLAMVPGQAPEGAAGVARLLEGAPPQAQATPRTDTQDLSRAVMMQIRDLQAGVEAFARQYPVVADLMQEVKQKLIQAMVKVVGSQPGPEAPAPPVVG